MNILTQLSPHNRRCYLAQESASHPAHAMQVQVDCLSNLLFSFFKGYPGCEVLMQFGLLIHTVALAR